MDVFPENQQPQVRMQLSANLEAVFSQRLLPKADGGRVLAYEIMTGSSAVKSAIREGRSHMLDNIIMTSAEFGMMTLESMLGAMVKKGVISMEIAQAYALRPADVARFARG